MSLEERAALADDMQRYGQKYEILGPNGNLIIDGRNRYLACKQVGLEPKVRRIKNDDPKALYRSMTFFRRHWTKKELAVFGAKLTIAEEVSTDGLEKLSNESNSTKDVASAMGVGEYTLYRVAAEIHKPRTTRGILREISPRKLAANAVKEEKKIIKKLKTITDQIGRRGDVTWVDFPKSLFTSWALENAKQKA